MNKKSLQAPCSRNGNSDVNLYEMKVKNNNNINDNNYGEKIQ